MFGEEFTLYFFPLIFVLFSFDFGLFFLSLSEKPRLSLNSWCDLSPPNIRLGVHHYTCLWKLCHGVYTYILNVSWLMFAKYFLEIEKRTKGTLNLRCMLLWSLKEGGKSTSNQEISACRQERQMFCWQLTHLAFFYVYSSFLLGTMYIFFTFYFFLTPGSICLPCLPLYGILCEIFLPYASHSLVNQCQPHNPSVWTLAWELLDCVSPNGPSCHTTLQDMGPTWLIQQWTLLKKLLFYLWHSFPSLELVTCFPQPTLP